MRISDWSSDVCSSDLPCPLLPEARIHIAGAINSPPRVRNRLAKPLVPGAVGRSSACHAHMPGNGHAFGVGADLEIVRLWLRSEEHTSELQSLLRISYAVFCLKKKKHKSHPLQNTIRSTSY